MRIAVVNAARNYGGQEAVAAVLARGLQGRGHDIIFLCRPAYPALDRLGGADVRIEPVLTATDFDPRGIWRCRRALRRHRSQVLLATTNKDMRSAALSAWSLGVPVVVRRAMARPLRDRLHYRVLYGRLPAHVVANSQATRRIMLRSAPWLDADRTSVIYNGIDLRPFERAERADLGVPPDAVTIGFVGRFVSWKGVRELADAWPRVGAAVPEAHLVWVGRGGLEPELRARLEGAERVRWAGFRDDIPAVMKALDVLAFPSWMEGFGLAAVEAMAAGTPVVGAREAALPEVVVDGADGVLVPPRDPEALASALVELALDPKRRARMSAAGRAKVARDFRRERMVDDYEALLTPAAQAARRPSHR